MSKKQIFNRIGEGVLGSLIGSSTEYERARRGGEDKTGKVVSAITGGTVGALAAITGSAAIRNMRTARNAKKVMKDPNYTSMVDRLATLENKLDEKVMRYKNWSREDALNRHYAKQKPLVGYPQNYSGAMDMLEKRKQDLVKQKSLMKQLGNPSFLANPQGYLDSTVASAKAGQIQKDIKSLQGLTSKVRRSTQQEFSDIRSEQDYVKEQMKRQQMLQREYLDEQQNEFSRKVNDRFMGLL